MKDSAHPQSSLPDACATCGQTCTSSCSLCRRMRYCSQDCVRLDWPRHHRFCIPSDDGLDDTTHRRHKSVGCGDDMSIRDSVASQTIEPIEPRIIAPAPGVRGSAGDGRPYVKAFVFLPELVRVLVASIEYTIGGSGDSPHTCAHFEEIVHLEDADCTVLRTCGPNLLHWPYQVWFSKQAFRDAVPSTENRSIATEFGRELNRPWFGPIVVLKFSNQRCDSYRNVEDIDTMVLRGFFNGEWY